MTNKSARVIPLAEGRTMNVLGHAVTIKLACNETNGDYYIFEVVSPPGLGIPPHVRQGVLLPTAYYTRETFRPASREPLETVLHLELRAEGKHVVKFLRQLLGAPGR